MAFIPREQFDRLRRLALRLAGLELVERHRDVLGRRVPRAGIGDSAAFDSLLDAAERGDEIACRRLIGLLTTNFTGFFRHPRQFEVAAEHALWAVHRRGHARLWSAAAATGEEPYSLAIASIEIFQRDDPAVTIEATDVDEEALAAARHAEYAEPALGTLDRDRRARFFGEEVEPGRWRVAPSARDLVTFRALNLADVVWPLEGPFDVLLCRNVLMYLATSHRYSVLERFASMLAPDGILILDPAEHLGEADHMFARGDDGIYSRSPRLSARRDRSPRDHPSDCEKEAL